MHVAAILQRAGALWPERVAIQGPGRPVTYRSLLARVAHRVQALKAAGIRPGDRVALLAANSPGFLESTFAVAAGGGVLTPLNTRLLARELGGIQADASPLVWLVDERHRALAEEVRAAAQDPFTILALDDHTDDDGSSALPSLPAADPHAPAQLYYTSGTSGRPKGVILTHANVSTHALAAALELDLTRHDTWAHIAPMFHLADAWATLAITCVGGRHAFFADFEPRATLTALARERVTITNLVPTILRRLLQAAEDDAPVNSALRMLLSGGAPIAPELVRRVVDTFRCEYVQTYGMTETSPFLTLSLLKEHLRALPPAEQLVYRAKTGRPFLTVELEVVDADDRPVANDEAAVGEIRVRGATVTPGYWRNPDATREALRDGWLYTGDLAVRDAEGYVTIVDRKRDMIVTGGENVYSTEVENALYEHSDVLEAAVYGAPDSEWGERVVAAVVVREPCSITAEELIAFCHERLAGFKCPKAVEFRAELEKTGSGKIKKSALREDV